MPTISQTITARHRTHQPLPPAWFPPGWTGPTYTDHVATYLAHHPDSDTLARHLDHHHTCDPATRDLLVAASLRNAHPGAGRTYRDELTTELYVVYGELAGHPRDHIVHRALVRARKRVYDPKRTRPVPTQFIDKGDERTTPGGVHVLDTNSVVIAGASRANPVVVEALAHVTLQRFRDAVLTQRAPAWPMYRALLAEELLGEQLPERPRPGHLARSRHRCHTLAEHHLR